MSGLGCCCPLPFVGLSALIFPWCWYSPTVTDFPLVCWGGVVFHTAVVSGAFYKSSRGLVVYILVPFYIP